MPTSGQIALLILAIAFFTVGGLISFARLRKESERLRIGAKACMYFGVLTSLIVLVWHSVSRGTWVPLGNNFNALIWMGLLLAGFVLYVQRRRPLGGLEWFVMPIVVLLLVLAGVFGRTKPHDYVDSAWSWVHSVTTYVGAVAFAIAFAVGAMYLISNRRLRNKSAVAGPNMGSLERLEHITFVSVTLGFALLTMGMVTGFIRVLEEGGQTQLGENWLANPKVLLALGVWVVYAVVLHSPMNPSFRGRKTAILSIFGFLLMIGALVATQFLPKGGVG